MEVKFKVMLASQDMPDLTHLRYPCYVQPKLDGFRAIYHPDHGFISRSGKSFRNKNLEEYFKSLKQLGSFVLDGELYIKGEPFQNLTSTVNKEGAEINNLKYYVYDCVPLVSFDKQEAKDLPYEVRIRTLRKVLNEDIQDYVKVIDLQTDLVSSPKEIKDLYSDYLKQGYEGVIIRRKDGNYKFGRSTLRGGELIKLKPFQSADLPVIDFYEGEGQFEGSLGGIICMLNNGLNVRVGSGFTIDNRRDIWDNKDKYFGKTVEVKYMEETEDGNLRHPIFMRWREDK
jgi:DNA ligase-1